MPLTARSSQRQAKDSDLCARVVITLNAAVTRNSMKSFLPGIAIIVILLADAGCTIAPKPVETHAIAFSDGVQNAGILGHDNTGLFVNAAWIHNYDAMLKLYRKQLPVSERVKPGDRSGITTILPGKRFHVNYEVNERYADLKYLERNSLP